MSAQSAILVDHVFLGRSLKTATDAILRCYESSYFDPSADDPVVLIQFESPLFEKADIAPLVGCDIEVSVFEDRAEVRDLYGDRTVILRAKRVIVGRSAYDMEDLIDRVHLLTDELRRDQSRLREAMIKKSETHNLIIELLRRAEIKSAASSHHAELQASAIAVLNRLLTKFKSENPS